MQKFPHVYRVAASADAAGPVNTESRGPAPIEIMSPPEFGGPGGFWSPETLLTASVADCFVLTFRAIARASRFDWTGLHCEAEGVLDRIDRVSRFTRFNLAVRLRIPSGSSRERAEQLLQKAEHNCLITNSLSAEIHLDVTVEEA